MFRRAGVFELGFLLDAPFVGRALVNQGFKNGSAARRPQGILPTELI